MYVTLIYCIINNVSEQAPWPTGECNDSGDLTELRCWMWRQEVLEVRAEEYSVMQDK